MISYKEAICKILENTTALPPKRLSIEQILGRGLAEAVIAPFDQPRFDNAAVDGYGVKVADLQRIESESVELDLVGTVKPGTNSDLILERGQSIKVLTGSKIPPGVEAVVMREYCLEEDSKVSINKSVKADENIRKCAIEFKSGAEILPAKLRITPPVIGLLASLGYSEYLVGDKPRVGIVVTGDELINPGDSVSIGKIYDANSYSLKSAIWSLGLTDIFHEKVTDQYLLIKGALKEALEQSDIVISSGGVSVGDFDFVKKALEELGVSTIFWQVAVKPGRPIYFGIYENGESNKLVFGLPGNTVSALISFHQFVKPAILKMMFIEKQPIDIRAVIDKTVYKQAGRLDLLRSTLYCDESGFAHAIPKDEQESHMLSGLALANGLIQFPAEDTVLQTGQTILAERLSWFD